MSLRSLFRRIVAPEAPPQNDLDPVLRDVYHFASELRIKAQQVDRELARRREA